MTNSSTAKQTERKVRETVSDLEDKIHDGAETVTQVVTDTAKQTERKVRETVSDLEDKIHDGAETVAQVVTDVDKRLHDNPWPIMAGVAVTFLMIGFTMGGSRR